MPFAKPMRIDATFPGVLETPSPLSDSSPKRPVSGCLREHESACSKSLTDAASLLLHLLLLFLQVTARPICHDMPRRCAYVRVSTSNIRLRRAGEELPAVILTNIPGGNCGEQCEHISSFRWIPIRIRRDILSVFRHFRFLSMTSQRNAAEIDWAVSRYLNEKFVRSTSRRSRRSPLLKSSKTFLVKTIETASPSPPSFTTQKEVASLHEMTAGFGTAHWPRRVKQLAGDRGRKSRAELLGL